MTLRKKLIKTRSTTELAKPILFVALLFLVSVTSFAQQPDLADKSLEDLMDIQVISVSKREQKLSRTASAIFVISAEDIARSGATNVPDLLRMVPGLQVAQIDSNTWAISARGLNALFSTQLLVLMDGRNLYTLTFGGVLWDMLNIPLENIERIEVIRGPGGTIWGANAVNGVVNIITKAAAKTKGGMLVAGGGNLEQGFGTLQFGGKLGRSTDYRVSTKYFNEIYMPGLTGQPGGDAWHLLRGGFRSDTTLTSKDSLTLESDIYGGKEGSPALFNSFQSPLYQQLNSTINVAGGFFQADWSHAYSARSGTLLQFSVDSYKRDDILREARKTATLDFQHHFSWGSRQDIVWGAGYSFSSSTTQGNFAASLVPAAFKHQVFNTFIQDEVAIIPDKVYFTIGTKFEQNPFTGPALMPSARLSWNLTTRSMLWAAVSQAQRTPSESDVAVRANIGTAPAPDGTPILLAFVGNPHFKNEGLIAYDLGYRRALTSHLSLDSVVYYNHYDHQQTFETGTPFFSTVPAPPHLVVPGTYENLRHGETHGIELAADWKATDRWTLSPGYTFEQIHMHLESASRDTTSVNSAEGSTPRNGAQLRSHLVLAHALAWDASAYFVDRLKSGEVPSYTRIDTGLTWHVAEGFALSVVGQNLAKDRHLEFVDPQGTLNSTLIKRSAYAKFTWKF